MKRNLPVLLAALLVSVTMLSSCTPQDTVVAEKGQPSPAQNWTSPASDLPENQPTPTTVVPEALLRPFETKYFDQITEVYSGIPDLASAIGTDPTLLTITGEYSGFQIVFDPNDILAALENIHGVLDQSGYARIDGVSARLDFTSGTASGDAVYFRALDKTYVSTRIEEGSLVVCYAVNDYDGPDVTTGDGSSYDGFLFNSYYYDMPVGLFRDDVPDPGAPLDAQPNRIDIDYGGSGLTFHYTIDSPNIRAESFHLTMEAAGFAENGETYTRDSVEVSILINPGSATSELSEAVVSMRFVLPTDPPIFDSYDQVDQSAIAIPVIEGEEMIDTARRWAEEYRQAVLALPENNAYHVKDIQLVAVLPSSEEWEEMTDVYTLGFAVKAPKERENFWLAGNSYHCQEGEYKGCIIAVGYITFGKEGDFWRSDGMFTGR